MTDDFALLCTHDEEEEVEINIASHGQYSRDNNNKQRPKL